MRQVSQVSPERLKEKAPSLYDLAVKMSKDAYGPLAILPEKLAVEVEYGKIIAVSLPDERHAKRYPPTDLEEATRPLREDEYCAACGYQHKGWPGASCGQPQ